MTAGLLALAKGKPTDDPYLAAIITAQEINRVSGGVLVAPWELGELTNDWFDAYLSYARDLPQMRKAQAMIDAKLAELRTPRHG